MSGTVISKPKLIDAHTHAHFAAYDADYKEVIKRALDQDIWLVNVGTQKDTSKKAVDVAMEYKEGVYATVGLHPTHTNKSFHDKKELGGGEAAQEFTSQGEDFDFGYYKNLAANPKVLAIGECGLDYFRLEEKTKDKQVKALEAQIELAYEIKKPLMIHCRDAYADLIGILNSSRGKLNKNPGIIHFFCGNKEDARELLNLGFYFSFGGVTTFTKDYDEVINYISLDNIILETDAPYVSPVPFRGKRNEPGYVKYVAESIARITGVSFEKTASLTTGNAKAVLQIN
jgi:TatD DNase family protein